MRFAHQLHLVERLGLTEAEATLPERGRLADEEPVILDHGTLQAEWRELARELSPLAGDRRRYEPVSLLVGLPATAAGPAGGAPALVDLHRQMNWYGAGLLGCELSAARLIGAGLEALPWDHLERLVHHMIVAFAWQGDAEITAHPVASCGVDRARRLEQLGVRLEAATGSAPAGTTAAGPTEASVLALGEGTEGLLWARWKYVLKRAAEPAGEVDERGVAPPGVSIAAWRHDPIRECRLHLIDALARGAADPAELRHTFPPSVRRELEVDLATLEELGQIVRSADHWALCGSSRAHRTAALLMLAPGDTASAEQRLSVSDSRPARPPAPCAVAHASEIGLVLQAARERIEVVVLSRESVGEHAGEEGEYAFFYPEEVRVAWEHPARNALRQLFQQLFSDVVRRYRPVSLERLVERLAAATRVLAARREAAGTTRTLQLVRASAAVARDERPVDDPVARSARLPRRCAPPWALGSKPSLIVSASNCCNLRCRFCLERGRRMPAQPDLATLLDSLRAVAPESVSHVVFMSGETLLRRDVGDLLSATRALGFRHVCVATNGTMLRDRQQLESLSDAGLSGIELSVHTLDAGRAAFISGRRATAQRVRRTLAVLNEVCADRTFGCLVNVVICQLNLPEVARMLDEVDRSYPAIAPRFVLKYPRNLDGIDGGVAPATLEQIRQSDIPALLAPGSGRQIEAVDFPLCALTPHHGASMNLVSFATGSWCVDLRPGSPPRAVYEKVLQSDQNVFAPICETCSARMLCCGVEPRYLAMTGADHGCRPLTRSPEEILTEAVQASRRLVPGGSPVEAAGLVNTIELLTHCWQVRRTSEGRVPAERTSTQPSSDPVRES